MRRLLALLLAALAAPGAGRAGEGRALDPGGWRRAGKAPVAVSFPHRAWAVTVDLAGFQVDGPDVLPDGRLVSLVGEEPESGVVASVTLSDAGGRRSAEACAEADWRRITMVAAEVAGVRRTAEGGRARAWYLVPTIDGRRVDQQNLSGWWYRDGVCVHVHASLMGFTPADAAKLERVLASVRFEEPL
ncbi:MAG TPA: hypothetical protein VFP50_06915 [Anaeromyxobacteraceae bacterium]|nr:hypothetical protein [Anaeromyxobacteraceae bacterium]